MKSLDDIKARGSDAEWAMYTDDDVPVLVAAVEAVLELHKPLYVAAQHDICSVCLDDEQGFEVAEAAWPCPTVTAIRHALGEEPCNT